MIENCPMRHENGNCIPAGGFCTANKNICEALLNAYRMGKEQLSKESTTSDLISRTAAIDAAEKIIERDTSGNNAVVNAMIAWSEYIRALPSAQPDLPIKEKCAFCPHCNNCDVNDDLSIQPCVDTISRQAAIDALDKRFDNVPMELTAEILKLRKDLRELPTIQPERQKGEWIEISSINHTYKCSECGRLLVNITDGKNNVAKNYPYCHCGADMRGEQDG